MIVKILIVEDHRLMRTGLRELLEKNSDMKVIGEAENGRQALRMIQNLNPDITIMDIGMPELNGIETTRKMLSIAPQIKILALSMHSSRHYVTEMLKAGASGYLLKDAAFEELLQAVRTIMNGGTYLSPDIAGVVVKQFRESTGQQHNPNPFLLLTEREREVLQQLAEGNSTKKIASNLFISTKTVETHRRHIMEKLDLHSIAELTKYALQEGITNLEN